MTNIQTSLFDYGSLSPDIANETKQSAELIKLILKRTAEDIVEIGRELIKVKANLDHGQFLPWIESEFEMSDRTARNFMSVADRLGDKLETVSDLSLKVLYSLAASSTTDEVIDRVLERAESGEKVDIAMVNQLKQLALVEENKKTPMSKSDAIALMKNKYSCISIDPPWHYELRVKDTSHRNRIPYQSMTFSEMQELAIPADPNGCVLFLWFTNNHMIEAGKLIEHWGFTYKNIITWEKISKNGNTRFGVGHWLRNCTEHCAIATKGKVKAFSSTSQIAKSTPNIIKAERREHSRKPEEFYKLVEELCSSSKLEMFSRQKRFGWDCIGDQTDYFPET